MKEKKRKYQPTLGEILRPDPDDLWFDKESGLYLELEYKMVTYKKMLEGFYRANGDVEKPITFTQVEDLGSAIHSKDWYAVMYRGWHIRIFQGPSLPGPHSAQLWYKSGTEKKNHWIATVQLMGFYYNEEEMLAALMQAIKDKEFFLSKREEGIELIP